ncbi:MAG: hypothetical protein RLZZ403_566 [Pseudomonadota bacterium]
MSLRLDGDLDCVRSTNPVRPLPLRLADLPRVRQPAVQLGLRHHGQVHEQLREVALRVDAVDRVALIGPPVMRV